MTNDTAITTILVNAHAFHGGYEAHSPDLPGLHIWGATIEEMTQRVCAGIKLLFKLGKNVDVEVFVADDVASFPHGARTARAVNQFVIAAAA